MDPNKLSGFHQIDKADLDGQCWGGFWVTEPKDKKIPVTHEAPNQVLLQQYDKNKGIW